MNYKVLSVHQPFAFLLCASIKDYENRTWKLPEKYKGERVLIHASAKWDDRHRDMSQLFTYDQWKSLPSHIQVIMSHGVLPISAIIGSVRFTDCVINADSIWAEKTGETRVWANGTEWFTKGKPIYNWKAEDAILFDKPILNVKGKLGFWEYDLPEEYAELLNHAK